MTPLDEMIELWSVFVMNCSEALRDCSPEDEDRIKEMRYAHQQVVSALYNVKRVYESF